MSEDISRLLSALTFAAERHRDQRRKDASQSPYINHPIGVANALATDGGVTDIELIVAGVLHDAIEDTDASSHEISALFGSKVASFVDEVSDDKSLSKTERKQRQIDESPKKSDGAKQLKIADKICNVRDIDEGSPSAWGVERKVEYLEWSSHVVDGCRGINKALDELFDRELSLAYSRLNRSECSA